MSIDYAIMEKSDNVYTIPGDFGWSDLGTWGALYDEAKKDDNNNAIQGENVLTFDVTNTLVRVPADKLVVLRGLDDFIVVDENGALLIYPKSKEQEIKQVTEAVKKFKGSQHL